MKNTENNKPIKVIRDKRFTEERALFRAQDTAVFGCEFDVGESPFKHSRSIEVHDSGFIWRYPIWYSEHVGVYGCTFAEGARAGMWYTNDITVRGCTIAAPKCFRRCSGVVIEDTVFPDGPETLWYCDGVRLKNVKADGDYFGMNCTDIEIENLELNGHYHFDGVRDLTIRDSRLITKDTFWNSENVTVENCFISGEYIGWNSKHMTFINCTIESLQGLCYIEDLVIRDCRFLNTTLAFEFSTVDASIIGGIDSIKNPSGGTIRAESIGELILEDSEVDTSKTRIIIG